MSLIRGNIEIADFQPPRYKTAELPTPSNNGRIITLTDGRRGFWVDNGSSWTPLLQAVDIRDFGIKVNDSNDWRSEFQAALNQVGAITYGTPGTTGGVLQIPQAFINIDNTTTSLTVPNGVRVLGQNLKWGALTYSASTIKGTGTTGVPLFDLSGSSHPALEKLSLIGGNGFNLGNHAVYASTVAHASLLDLNIDRWGGCALYLGGGLDNDIHNNQCTNVLRGYAGLTDYTGAFHLKTGETHMTYCNINGPIGDAVRGDITAQTITAGTHDYACGIVVDGGILRANQVVAAFADHGWYFAFRNLHVITNCRGERCQGNGWLSLMNQSEFNGCIAADNSRDADGTYSGFKIGTGGVTGYENTITNCKTINVVDATYKDKYGFEINSGAGATYSARNIFANNRVGANDAAVQLYSFTGSTPYEVSGIPVSQALSGTGTQTFDGQKGRTWVLTVNANTATMVSATNLLAGQVYTLYIIQNAAAPTITLDTVFAKYVGFTSPGGSKHLSCQFRSDGTSLYQVNAWSGDM